MKKLLSLAIALILLVSLAACSSQTSDTPASSETSTTDAAQTGSSQKLQRISIGGGSTGGAYYIIAGGLANIINEKVENVEATVEVTGGGIENINLMDSGDAQFGLANTDTAMYGVEGHTQFDSPKNILFVASLYPSTMQIVVRADSGIETIDQIRGKKVAIGAPGSGNAQASLTIMSACGIAESDVKIFDLAISEMPDALKDGTIDVAFIQAGIPTSSVMDLANTIDIRILELDEATRKAITEQYVYYGEMQIGTDVYGLDPVWAVGVTNSLVCSADLDEELVYQVTKTLFENLDELHKVHTITNLIDVNKAYIVPCDLHPGAIRYYKEIGLM